MPTAIGHVTEDRYQLLVQEGRKLVGEQTRSQFGLGDRALEIEPIGPHGGAHPASEEQSFGVSEVLRMYAEDIGVPATTLTMYRWVSSRWPQQRRVPGVSHYIHRVLAGVDDRFDLIAHPPLNPRTGQHRWDTDNARRTVGWRPSTARTAQEKLDRIHDLAKDDTVAAAVTKDLLKRPNVAFEAMADHSARHAVNSAQFDHSTRAVERARRRTPAIDRVDHAIEFVDLIGACAQFVATVGRVLPTLRAHAYTGPEREAVQHNVVRVRSTADWIETTVANGHTSIDEGLARILGGD